MKGRLMAQAALLVVLCMVLPSVQGAVLAPDKTEILFDGEKIHGLKGFTYKAYKDRQDVRGIGMNERVQATPATPHVRGKILVHSNSELLNKHMEDNTHFQVILSVMQDSYPEGLGIKQFTFDGCHVDARELYVDDDGNSKTYYAFSASDLGTEFDPHPDPWVGPSASLTFDGTMVQDVGTFSYTRTVKEAEAIYDELASLKSSRRKAAGTMVAGDGGVMTSYMEDGEPFSMNLYSTRSLAKYTQSNAFENAVVTGSGLEVDFTTESPTVRSTHTFLADVVDGPVKSVLPKEGVTPSAEAPLPPEEPSLDLERTLVSNVMKETGTRQALVTSRGAVGLSSVTYTVEYPLPDFKDTDPALSNSRLAGSLALTTDSPSDVDFNALLTDREIDIIRGELSLSGYYSAYGKVYKHTYGHVLPLTRTVGQDAWGNDVTVYGWVSMGHPPGLACGGEAVPGSDAGGSGGVHDCVASYTHPVYGYKVEVLEQTPDLPAQGEGRASVLFEGEDYSIPANDLLGLAITPSGDVSADIASYQVKRDSARRSYGRYEKTASVTTRPGSDLDTRMGSMSGAPGGGKPAYDTIQVVGTDSDGDIDEVFLVLDVSHIDDREFQIDSHGYALTTYTFTGDRLREA